MHKTVSIHTDFFSLRSRISQAVLYATYTEVPFPKHIFDDCRKPVSRETVSNYALLAKRKFGLQMFIAKILSVFPDISLDSV